MDKTQSCWPGLITKKGGGEGGMIIKKGKTLFICVKSKFVASVIVVPPCLEKKLKKMSIRVLTKCRCVSVVVLLQNGLGNGIVVDTGCFRIRYMEEKCSVHVW